MKEKIKENEISGVTIMEFKNWINKNYHGSKILLGTVFYTLVSLFGGVI